MNKYGYNTVFKIPEVVNKIANSKIRKEHEYITKKRNNSFHISNPENKSYELLKQKYPDVKYQYRSELYPFNCDFYIPSLNLYIECNYHWTHGGHPYNPNNLEDKKKVKLWKSKNTKFYNIGINTWTQRDVNKRNIAKQNNLNYLEFWNINELIQWIKNL